MSAQALRPLVVINTQSNQIATVGANGDSSVPVLTTTIWANSSDHTQTYGRTVSGYWQWNYNLFPAFSFPGAAFFFAGLGGTVQSGSLQMDLELLDASSTILTRASMLVNYSVDLTTIPGFTYSVSAGNPTVGTEKIEAWSAVRVRSTCSNTNLHFILNYGPLAGPPDPSAYAAYAAPFIIVDRYY